MESPKQCIKVGETLVEAYGLETATKQIEDNIEGLTNAYNLIKIHPPNTGLFNIAFQLDFWSQVLQTIKK